MLSIDLILCTIGRTDEIGRFLESVCRQNHRELRVIVVDQNPDNRLHPIVSSFEDRLDILLIHSEKGLSRARNKGLDFVSSDVVMFPDDDCVYPDGLLKEVATAFASGKMDLLTFRAESFEGDPVGPRWIRGSRYFSRREVWNAAISYSIAVSRSMIDEGIRFDEMLGVGSGTAFGSGEETDFVLQCLAAGGRGYFDESLYAVHPKFEVTDQIVFAGRKIGYARGAGFVAGKHGYSRLTLLTMCGRPLLARLVGRGHCARLNLKDTLGVSRAYFAGFLAGSRTKNALAQVA